MTPSRSAAYGSIVSENGGKFVCVGRDGRLSSPDMLEALGRFWLGINVVDIGLAATPMLYYASKMLDAPGAIMMAVRTTRRTTTVSNWFGEQSVLG